MSLNALLPDDTTTTLAELNALLRETRLAVNTANTAITALGGAVASAIDLVLTSGTTQIIVGTDMGAIALELVNLTAGGACVIDEIVSGTAGQMKIIVFGDTNITLTNNSAKIDLNCVGNFTGAVGDVIALVNVDGDPATVENGYWKEIFRNLAV
jgi:hypothetical protein